MPWSKTNRHPLLWLVLMAGAVAVICWVLGSRRHGFVPRNVNVAEMLPDRRDATAFFVNVKLLRESGYLRLFTNKVQLDPEYQQFVAATGFDYGRDLDAIAGSVGAQNQIECFLKGSFDWNRFQSYAQQHRGSCARETCIMPGSEPDRWILFSSIQTDVMGLLITSKRPVAADPFRDNRPRAPTKSPAAPVWIRPAASLLQMPNRLPFALRIFAITLQSAGDVTVSLNRSAPPAVFDVTLDAWFENPAVADTARNQLQMNTKLLKIELAREHGAPNPADLTGLLTAGVFTTNGKELRARWPLQKQFLEALR